MKADVIFYHGLHLEGKLLKVLDKLKVKKPVFSVTDHLNIKDLIADSENQKMFDPHIWFDMKLWSQVVAGISSSLSKIDNKNSHVYHKNSMKYQAQLKTLDQEISSHIAAIPKEQRILITAHDAFSYFARAYHFDVVSLQGINTDAEFSLRDVQRVIRRIVDSKINTIFAEQSISDRALRAVLEGAKNKGAPVKLGTKLYSDSLGTKVDDADHLVGMIRYNTKAIVSGLTRR
jgi:manganese/zinc/iron transport system substrate-binding protein